MAKYSKKTQKSQTNLQELVIVTFAEGLEQAKEYEALLKTSEIPVMLKNRHKQPETSKGIAVMVPEDFVDEARVVIESQDAYNDFYDFVLENEDEQDFDGDLFDDEF